MHRPEEYLFEKVSKTLDKMTAGRELEELYKSSAVKYARTVIEAAAACDVSDLMEQYRRFSEAVPDTSGSKQHVHLDLRIGVTSILRQKCGLTAPYYKNE